MLAWHYTVAPHVITIMKAMELVPIPIAGAPKRERPVIWFSTNQHYDMSACKGWEQNGSTRWLNMQETHERGGLMRIGVEATILRSMGEFIRLSGIPHQHLAGLLAIGREKGANPDEWLVSFRPLPLSDWRAVEKWTGEHWVNALPTEDGN